MHTTPKEDRVIARLAADMGIEERAIRDWMREMLTRIQDGAESIERAHRDSFDFAGEMAQGETRRARLLRDKMASAVYREINATA